MNVEKMKKQSRDLLQVYDNGGSERSGEEVIEVWRSHFTKVLGGDDEGDRETSCTQVNSEETQPESSEHLGEPISREEVQRALNEVKKDVAPGLDGVVMDMMLTERLFEVWLLFSSFAGSMEGSLPCGERVLLCLYPRSRSGECVM